MCVRFACDQNFPTKNNILIFSLCSHVVCVQQSRCALTGIAIGSCACRKGRRKKRRHPLLLEMNIVHLSRSCGSTCLCLFTRAAYGALVSFLFVPIVFNGKAFTTNKTFLSLYLVSLLSPPATSIQHSRCTLIAWVLYTFGHSPVSDNLQSPSSSIPSPVHLFTLPSTLNRWPGSVTTSFCRVVTRT